MTNERDKLELIAKAADKRAEIFGFSDEGFFISDKLRITLGLTDDIISKLSDNIEMLKECIFNMSTEVETPSGANYRHYFGILDKDERYLIINSYVGESFVYGLAVDKTAEVYNVFKINDEISKLKKALSIDNLTQLINRSAFEMVVSKSLDVCPTQGIMIIIDMDNFKLVNDSLGHPVGDIVLKKFADMTRKHFSMDDCILGRLGGDEFMVFISRNLPLDELSEMIDKFIEDVRIGLGREYPEQKLSVSVGAVYSSNGISDYLSLYKIADKALYHVKNTCKGSYHIIS